MKDLNIWADRYKEKNGVTGLYKKHYEWINGILEMKVIKLGRLQFELLETIDGKLHILLGNTENINNFLFVNVYIRYRERLNPEECEKSYTLAVDFYKSKGYFFSGIVFICHLWLLNPDLKILFSENSNIIQFQKKHNFISSDENEKNPQIIERVFNKTVKEIKDWEQNIGLQKNLKEMWEKEYRFPMTKRYFIISSL